MVEYRPDSVYRSTPVNDIFLEAYVPPIDNLSLEDTVEYIIPAEFHQRPDLCAFELYKNSNFWWVFILYNRNLITDPLFDFKENTKIRVPITLV